LDVEQKKLRYPTLTSFAQAFSTGIERKSGAKRTPGKTVIRFLVAYTHDSCG
jgi:hypothetical protein